MEFKRKRLIQGLLVLSIVAILAFTIASIITPRRSLENLKESKFPSRLVFAKGISFVEYHGDKRVYSVAIDHFYIDRAKLGPFAIGPLNMAHFNNVQADLYLDEVDSTLKKKGKKDSETEEIDFGKVISGIRKNLPRQVKRIVGIDFKDVSLSLWKNGDRIFRISGDSATVDRKTGDFVFTGHAIMDAGEKGNLKSYRIRWDRETSLFKVTDAFIGTITGKKIEGREIETDYLFKRVNYSVSKKKTGLGRTSPD